MKTEINDRIKAMEPAEMRTLLVNLIDDLYGDGDLLDPDKEWSGDVFQNVASTLDGADLAPSEPEANPFFLANREVLS